MSLDREQRPRLTTEGTAKITGGRSDISLPAAEAEHVPTCRRCGHPLTADVSVRRLLGPICARHEVERIAATLHEPSAWLRGRVAERAARARQLGMDPTDATGPLVVMPLGRPGVPGERSDRECDRCGRYVPEHEAFALSQLYALPGLLLVGGLCTSCAAREVGEVPR